ncbi:beta strand repeat-containing protein [Myroides sp. LJL110]
MKKKILSVGLLFISTGLLAQVGIGTLKPNAAALLDVKVEDKDYKGVLLPRIPLESNTDTTTISINGDSESLLIYNTTSNSVLQPGYYYWFGKQWVRLINSEDTTGSGGVSNERFVVNLKTQSLELFDTDGKSVSIPLSEINILSTLTKEPNGVYLYTDESGAKTLVDVPGDVINNISEILNDQSVITEIQNQIVQYQQYLFNIIASNGRPLQTSGTSLSIMPQNNTALLSELSIDVLDKGIAPIKIEPAQFEENYQNGNYILATTNGQVRWVRLVSDIIRWGLNSQEKITLLIPDPEIDGKFTYYNEATINKEGDIYRPGVTINSNTLQIDNLNDVFVFNDGQSRYDGTPLAIIDIPGVVNNKVETILKSETVQNEIVNLVNENGKNASSQDQSIAFSDPNKVFLKPLDITVADKGISNSKIADQAVDTRNMIPYNDNAVLATTYNSTTGQTRVQWVGQNNPIWEEIIRNNETVTRLIDNSNGTFTYFNEQSSVDSQGNPIGGITFNANTLTISQDQDNIYVFTDMDSTTPLAIIDTRANSIIFEGDTIVYDNVQDAITDIINRIESLENQKQENGNLQGDGIVIGGASNGEAAVLKDVTLSIADGAITQEKMSAGLNKENFVPVAQQDGSVVYKDINSTISKKGLTLGDSFLATGDVNTALLSEVSLSIKDSGIQNKHLAPLGVTTDKISSTLDGVDAVKNSVLVSNGSGLASFIAPNSIVQAVAQGDLQGASPGPIVVNNGSNVLFGNATTTVDISEGGIKEKYISFQAVTQDKLAPLAVTSDKLFAGQDNTNSTRIALADQQGNVSYQPLSVDLLTSAKSIQGDGIIKIEGGDNSVLSEVNLSIENSSVSALKLTGGLGDNNRVAVSNDQGEVSYRALLVSDLPVGEVSTDGIIQVSKKDGVVLSDVTISLNDNSIGTTQLIDNSITNQKIGTQQISADKLSSFGATQGMVLTSFGDGTSSTVKWAPIAESLPNMGANLNGDEIINVVNGDGSVLKDVELSITDHSITIQKLSSESEDANLVFVTNGQGGFEYTTLDAIQADGAKLTLGDALSLEGNADKAVLVPITIDVKDAGITTQKLAQESVTVAKINPESALENSVLSVTSNSQVEFKPLNPAVFSDQGKDLLNTDGSISVDPDNKALLSELIIGVAQKGIKTQHIDLNAVGYTQINSKLPSATNIANGYVLSADGQGNTTFSSLQDIASVQGKSITTDNSLLVATDNKAVLQDVQIVVAPGGITTKHIGDKAVHVNQISSQSQDVFENYVLVADGFGATKYIDPSSFITATGKSATGGTGITISNGSGAVLQDIEVSISDGGVGSVQLASGAVISQKIATGAVTNDKLAENSVNSTNIISNAVTSDKILDGSIVNSKLAVQAVATNNIIDGAVSSSKIGDKAVLTTKLADQAVTEIKLADLAVSSSKIANSAVLENKLGDLAVTTNKLGDNAVTTSKIANNAVVSEKIAGGQVKTINLATNSVTGDKIANSSVSTDKIIDSSVTTSKIKNLAVTSNKISSENADSGFVLTAEGDGTASFKPASGISQGSGELIGDGVNGPLVVVNGENATFKDVTVSLAQKSITSSYLANAAVKTINIDQLAVATNQLMDLAVTTSKLSDKSVATSKIADNAVTGQKILTNTITQDKFLTEIGTTGYILTSDGQGGAEFLPPSSTGSTNVFSKLFYMPPVYVDVVSGASGELDLYGVYASQFGKPMVSSTNSQNALPVASKENLNYHVLYYDQNVFTSVTVDENGTMKYTTVTGAKPTARTFFSIVLELK